MDDKMTIVPIPLDMLEPHPDNPRKDLGDLTELADSIKTNGIMQNLTVVASPDSNNKYRVVIGHRRMAAAKLAGLTELPCVVSDMDHKEQVATMLAENMQRSDLTVYEQAWGFQQMTILGCSVEEISSKSGFSQSTVRRRLKMAELDQNTLRSVSTRQISLMDFDKLSEIEDLRERNKVLANIGTRDFDASVSRALTAQQERKNRPLVKAWLKKVGAKEISNSDTWNGKYENYPGCSYYIYVAKWGEDGNTPPKEIKDDVFYRLESSSLRLFRKKKKAKPEKKPPEQIAREKAISETWAQLEQIGALAHDLRKQFVEKLAVTGKNRQTVLYGALLSHLLEAVDYNSPDRNSVCAVFGIETSGYDSKRDEKLAEGVAKITDAVLPTLVYDLFGDSAKELCTDSGYRGNYPKYKRSVKLRLIYEWLQLLGYEPSTDELLMLDGSHEAYHRGDEK